MRLHCNTCLVTYMNTYYVCSTGSILHMLYRLYFIRYDSYIYIYICVCVCKCYIRSTDYITYAMEYTRIYVYTLTCMYIYMYIYIHICVCPTYALQTILDTLSNILIYAYTHVHIYIHIHIHTCYLCSTDCTYVLAFVI